MQSFAALLPVVRAEGGRAVAESAVQQRAMLREQMRVRGAWRLWVAWSGEN